MRHHAQFPAFSSISGEQRLHLSFILKFYFTYQRRRKEKGLIYGENNIMRIIFLMIFVLKR